MSGNAKSAKKPLKNQKAKSSMEIPSNVTDEELDKADEIFTKNNVIQYVFSLGIILGGIVVGLFFSANTSIEIGSIVYGDTSVSSIRICLGPLLILVGTVALIFAFKYNIFKMHK